MYLSRMRIIFTSAYLTGMLVSSMPALRADATLASALNLNQITVGLQTAGFQTGGLATAQAVPASLASVPPAQAEEPVISEEQMARLIIRTKASKQEGIIGANVCVAFSLCDGSADIRAKQVSGTRPEGKRIFIMPEKAGNKELIIGFVPSDDAASLEIYLTDNTGKLRAAALKKNDVVRLIRNEQAEEKDKAHMAYFAMQANKLPPSDAPKVADAANG